MDKNEVIEGLRGLKELFREEANLQIVLDEAIKSSRIRIDFGKEKL